MCKMKNYLKSIANFDYYNQPIKSNFFYAINF